jgi:DNA-binding response OmpR family regulator
MDQPPFAPQSRVYRVLVVEDNLDAVHTTCFLLREMGHTVEYALNGFVALEVARRFKPDFVLLDVGLPGVDGFDVCRQIRRDPELMNVKVVIVTAYDSANFRELGEKAGCDHYFVKPLSVKELTRLLGDMAANRTA